MADGRHGTPPDKAGVACGRTPHPPVIGRRAGNLSLPGRVPLLAKVPNLGCLAALASIAPLTQRTVRDLSSVSLGSADSHGHLACPFTFRTGFAVELPGTAACA